MTLSSRFQPDRASLHRAIIEQAQDAVIFADRAGIIQLWNRGAEIIFGYAAAEALGQCLARHLEEVARRAGAETQPV